MYGMEYQAAQYRCQKHGDIGTVIMNVTITHSDQPTQIFRYCMYCYSEFLAKNVCQAEEIKVKDPK